MNHEERHERAQRARQACEAELNRLLAEHHALRGHLEALTRALVLLRARERALERHACEEANA